MTLREEVDAIVGEDGWTKNAMQKLKKLDSFMRESQRMNGISNRRVHSLAPMNFH